jgi:hypothetical protein
VLAPIWWRRAGRLECLLAQRVVRHSRDAPIADAEDVEELASELGVAYLGEPGHLRPEDDRAGGRAASSRSPRRIASSQPTTASIAFAFMVMTFDSRAAAK